jgi:hypothetical protein
MQSLKVKNSGATPPLRIRDEFVDYSHTTTHGICYARYDLDAKSIESASTAAAALSLLVLVLCTHALSL